MVHFEKFARRWQHVYGLGVYNGSDIRCPTVSGGARNDVESEWCFYDIFVDDFDKIVFRSFQLAWMRECVLRASAGDTNM